MWFSAPETQTDSSNQSSSPKWRMWRRIRSFSLQKVKTEKYLTWSFWFMCPQHLSFQTKTFTILLNIFVFQLLNLQWNQNKSWDYQHQRFQHLKTLGVLVDIFINSITRMLWWRVKKRRAIVMYISWNTLFLSRWDIVFLLYFQIVLKWHWVIASSKLWRFVIVPV